MRSAHAVVASRGNCLSMTEQPGTFTQVMTARDLGITERGWRKIIKVVSEPKTATAFRIGSRSSGGFPRRKSDLRLRGTISPRRSIIASTG